jgi:cytoskeletal protein CcmA (bactofilin family)
MIWKKSEVEESAAQSQPQPQHTPAVVPRSPAQPAKDRALIGPTIEIKGDLTGGEDLFVEGRIEGKIDLRQHSITIGTSGRVKADIYGHTIVVQGEVDGNIFGEEQIVLHQSSTVRGNLLAPRITLEDGSHFKGSIDMTPNTAIEAQPPQPAGSEPRPMAAQNQRQE